jgi:hypothetical protein
LLHRKIKVCQIARTPRPKEKIGFHNLPGEAVDNGDALAAVINERHLAAFIMMLESNAYR